MTAVGSGLAQQNLLATEGLVLAGKSVYSHRFSYYLATGELPSEVRHLCRNPCCCRPNHLIGGDSSSNLLDQLVHRLRDSL